MPTDSHNGARVRRNAIAPSGVYLPNDNLLTPFMRSPEYVQVSTAAATTLGIMRSRMYRCRRTRCLNLLLTYPEGCRANCAYCGLARHRETSRDYADRNFIRVDWPAVPLEKIIETVAAQGKRTPFHRMCISMITHPRSDEDARTVLASWKARIDHVPVSILSNPATMTRRDVQELRDLGADIFTVALDAATPELFDRTRGREVKSPHRWEKYWEILHYAAEIFGPERFGIHLIVGLGESERDAILQIQRIRDLGGHSHLFAFFPEQGSLMDHVPAVPREGWRRVQMARYLIDYREIRMEAMRFDDDGRLLDSGVSKDTLEAAIEEGIAFRTSGCPGKFRDDISACDRPYGDSPPSDIASYPFQPNRRDIKKIRRQLGYPKSGD